MKKTYSSSSRSDQRDHIIVHIMKRNVAENLKQYCWEGCYLNQVANPIYGFISAMFTMAINNLFLKSIVIWIFEIYGVWICLQKMPRKIIHCHFVHLKCPECDFDNREENFFQDHVTENHSLSYFSVIKTLELCLLCKVSELKIM